MLGVVLGHHLLDGIHFLDNRLGELGTQQFVLIGCGIPDGQTQVGRLIVEQPLESVELGRGQPSGAEATDHQGALLAVAFLQEQQSLLGIRQA